MLQTKDCCASLVKQVLLQLLSARPLGSGGSPSFHPRRVCALACRCLEGLGRDPSIRSMLGTLQVCFWKAWGQIFFHVGGVPLHLRARKIITMSDLPSHSAAGEVAILSSSDAT